MWTDKVVNQVFPSSKKRFLRSPARIRINSRFRASVSNEARCWLEPGLCDCPTSWEDHPFRKYLQNVRTPEKQPFDQTFQRNGYPIGHRNHIRVCLTSFQKKKQDSSWGYMLSTLNFSNLWSVDRKPDFAVHEQQNRVCDQPTTDSKNSGSKAYTLKRNLVFFFETMWDTPFMRVRVLRERHCF